MTTELKPCPFCGTEPTVHRSLVAYKSDGKHPAGEYEESVSISCHACGFEMSDEFREDVSKKWNTRAVPDVPELVRYDLACDFDGKRYPYIIEVELGDYVLYDQVAGIITAERQRAEAAEADNKRLREALEPFAGIADLMDEETSGIHETDETYLHTNDYLIASWKFSLFKDARAALEGGEK